jgi:glycosyltransferase involved in cell wall biosynthesis
MTKKVLFVAAPLVSRGGVYSYLETIIPELRARGWSVGVVYALRVPGQIPHADWTFRVDERSSTDGRMSQLRGAVGAAMEQWCPNVVVSVLPQSDLACAHVVPGDMWLPMIHGRPVPASREAPLARRLAWRTALRWAYRRATTVLAVSDAAARDAHFVGIRDAITVPNGVTVQPERIRTELGDPPTLGFVGRLSHEKAPDVFVDVARLLSVPAKIIGDGPLAPTIKAAVSALPKCEFVGWRERDVVYDDLDLVIMPSRREALPLVALEAGARRIPVVARAVGGIPEVFGRDQKLLETCVVEERGTPAAFEEKARVLLEDASLRRDAAARLHAVVAAQFSLEASAHALDAVLRSTARSSSRVGRSRTQNYGSE